MTLNFDELEVPPVALQGGGVEVLRASVVDGSLHVSLRRAFDDPQAWGMLLADVTRHIARIYEAEENVPAAQTIERIRNLFDAEMDAPTEPGSTNAID